MATGFQEGKEYSLEDQEEWSAVVPSAGTVIEVNMAETSRPGFQPAWAAFFIVGVTAELDGSTVLEVKYIGCDEEDMAADLTTYFGRSNRYIHLCLSKPCIVVGAMDAIHATGFRLWKVENFEADYVEDNKNKALQRWARELAKAAVAPPRGPGPAKAKPAARPKIAKKKPAVERPGKAEDPGLEEKKKKLREKLKSLRATGDKETEEPGLELLDSEPDGRAGSVIDSPDYVPSEGLVTATQLEELPAEKKEKKKEKKDPSKKTQAIVPYRDTKDGTTKGLTDQLLRRALAVKDVRDKEKKKALKKKRSSSTAVGLLRQILTSSQDKKSKKKKDKQGRKKKKQEKFLRRKS